jgi:quinol monooxygenase YgiN
MPSPTNWQKWMHWHKKEHSDKQAYFAYRYYVEPDDRKDFEDAWLELEEATTEEKGNLIYDLKKPLSNNVEYIGYGEWESYEDAMDHYESKYVEKFIDRLAELDIPYTIVPLVRPDVAELAPDEDQKDEEQQAHVIIHYMVPPHAQEEFEEAWDRAEKGTEEEKGAHIYSLRKVFNNNYAYYAYGTWDSMSDYQTHFESDHVHELRKTLNKHGIVWHLSPLKKIGHQPE